MAHLLKEFPREKVYRVMEVFGARDSILKKLDIDTTPKKATKKVNTKK